VKALPVVADDRMEIARASCLAVDVALIARTVAGDASLGRTLGVAGQSPAGDVVADRNFAGGKVAAAASAGRSLDDAADRSCPSLDHTQVYSSEPPVHSPEHVCLQLPLQSPQDHPKLFR
jgi:hypothetical protein